MDPRPHDGAQSQLPDRDAEASSETSTTTPDAADPDAPGRATPNPQPVIAAPGKPDGEVDTRR